LKNSSSKCKKQDSQPVKVKMSEQTPRAKKELPLPSPRKSGRKSHVNK